MRILLLVTMTLATVVVTSAASAAQSSACKQCADHRKRCMANYPGPTCKVDYDICVKNCRSKS